MPSPSAHAHHRLHHSALPHPPGPAKPSRQPRHIATISFALLLVSLSLILRFPTTHSILPRGPVAPDLIPATNPVRPPSSFLISTALRSLSPLHEPRSNLPLPQPLPLPPSDFPHKCHIVGHNPALRTPWAFNTRAFCLTSAICLRPSTRASNTHLYTAADPRASTCVTDSPGLRALPAQPHLNCTHLQRRHVHCAQGKYRRFSQPDCPVFRPLNDPPDSDRASLRWRDDDEIAIVVPALPFSRNIYHFSYIAAFVAQIAEQLPALQKDWLFPPSAQSVTPTVTSPPTSHVHPLSLRNARIHVVYRGYSLSRYAVWQRTVLAAVLRPHRHQYRSIRVSFLDESSRGGGLSGTNTRPGLCFRRAVFLDARRNLNAWPFSNGTAVSHGGEVAPAASVTFRRAVLDAVGIASTLPRRLPLVDGARLTFALPPRVVGYSRREMGADPAVRQRLGHGQTRRFTSGDEAWFRGMLHEEGLRAGMEVREFKLSAKDSVAKQVRTLHELGVVVGIHGANLVNAMFMQPFSGLVEIFAGNTNPQNLPCYVAGANSGLAYEWHEGSPATRAESGCSETDEACWRHPRGRLVKIGTEEHRREIRRKVAAALGRVVRLHEQFPDGVPVRYDAGAGEMIIDDERIDESLQGGDEDR